MTSEITDAILKTITTTKLGRLNRSSEWIQLTDQGLIISQIRFFHYHKVNKINIRRSTLSEGYCSGKMGN